MTGLIYLAAFCVVAVLVYMGRYSGRLHATHSRWIDAPLAQVRARVADLRRWPEWNPWLENLDGGGNAAAMSPGAAPTSIDASADACSWSRAGVAIGAIGNRRARDPARIEQHVRLRRPFPLRGRSAWQFAELKGGTQVTWSLRGRVAFTMRAFAPTVQGSIALDIRYGLDRLASLLEPAGAPRYAISYAGSRDIAELRYAYIAHEGRIEGVGAAMAGVVADVRARLAGQGVQAEGEAIGVYMKTDIKRRTTVVRFGVPVGNATVDGLDVATLPAHRAAAATLRGGRADLEVAWYLLMRRLSDENVQPDLRIAPIERYLEPAERADDLARAPDGAARPHGPCGDNDAVTELLIAVR